jgi:hypothetical protein
MKEYVMFASSTPSKQVKLVQSDFEEIDIGWFYNYRKKQVKIYSLCAMILRHSNGIKSYTNTNSGVWLEHSSSSSKETSEFNIIKNSGKVTPLLLVYK